MDALDPGRLDGDIGVFVQTPLNGGRYVGRRATIIEIHSWTNDDGERRTSVVVQLEEWFPGREPPDGVLFLRPSEICLEGTSRQTASD